MMPSGVQGTKVCSSIYNFPIFIGWKPSTSLSGLIASNIFCSLTCFGSGTCTKIPLTESSLFSLFSSFNTSSSVAVSSKCTISEIIPIFSAAFFFDLT